VVGAFCMLVSCNNGVCMINCLCYYYVSVGWVMIDFNLCFALPSCITKRKYQIRLL
jgi:hypothetical protein